MRGTTLLTNAGKKGIVISIHVPREGDDRDHSKTELINRISIHVPREGDDGDQNNPQVYHAISIHVPREGDDAA